MHCQLPVEMKYCDPDIALGNEVAVGIGIDDKGSFSLYYNGKLFASRSDMNWQGGYLGLMTYKTDATISSFTVTYGNPKANAESVYETARSLKYSKTVDLSTYGSLSHVTDGTSFECLDDEIVIDNLVTQNMFAVSDLFVKPGEHDYIELKATIT